MAEAERQSTFITTRFERWALPRIAAALPRWVMPDHLTALGVLGATVIVGGLYLVATTDVDDLAALIADTLNEDAEIRPLVPHP